MSIYEKATLVLNSVNASRINSMRSSITWNNINLFYEVICMINMIDLIYV